MTFDPQHCHPRESGDPVAFAPKTLDPRFRGNDDGVTRSVTGLGRVNSQDDRHPDDVTIPLRSMKSNFTYWKGGSNEWAGTARFGGIARSLERMIRACVNLAPPHSVSRRRPSRLVPCRLVQNYLLETPGQPLECVVYWPDENQRANPPCRISPLITPPT
jgi:hypothetical protein